MDDVFSLSSKKIIRQMSDSMIEDQLAMLYKWYDNPTYGMLDNRLPLEQHQPVIQSAIDFLKLVQEERREQSG